MNLERIERMVYCSIGHSFMNRRIRQNVLCNIRLLEQSPLPSLPSSLLLSPSSSLSLLFTIFLTKENGLLCLHICSYFNSCDKQFIIR